MLYFLPPPILELHVLLAVVVRVFRGVLIVVVPRRQIQLIAMRKKMVVGPVAGTIKKILNQNTEHILLVLYLFIRSKLDVNRFFLKQVSGNVKS